MTTRSSRCHQYIAPIYEVGRDEDGRYYLVMDYIHGETAEAVYKRRSERGGLLPVPFSLTVVSAVALALDYAHALRAADGTPLEIVHRDVSLSNVMIGYDGSVKLIDFGIAKAANRGTKTAVGMLKGKLAYLAPEQVVHRHVDHRADIFALGIVLYELTTMARAFRAESDLLTMERITTGTVIPPSQIVATYPNELEHIVMRALRVDPDQRYQTASAMAAELEAYARSCGYPLGHGAIVETMTQLFSARRRRFARSSADIQSDPHHHALVPGTPDPESEVTPVVPMDDLVTPPEPVHAIAPEPVGPIEAIEPIERIEPIEIDETTEPRELPTPVPLPPAPQVRFSRQPSVTPDPLRTPQPSPFSGTALVRRPPPPVRIEPWWIAIGVFVIAVLIAIFR
jgi:serine/threonine protein kinase